MVVVLRNRLFVHVVCNVLKQLILHLFCFFPVVDQFWNEVFSCMSCHFKRDVNFCNFTKSFGFEELEIVLRRIGLIVFYSMQVFDLSM